VPDSASVQDARNLADLVRRAARSDPDRSALWSEDHMLTWGELDRRVDAAARGLARHAVPGAPHPARVAIALGNTPDFAVAYFGVLRAGLVAVPVNPEYTARELRHVLGDSGAAVLIGTADVVEAIEPVRPALPALELAYTAGAGRTGTQSLAALVAGAGDPVEPSTGDEDLAVLIYTSGTSGQPKGAMLSHRALLANHAQLAEVEPALVGPDDVVLLAVPLFHAYGLNSGLGAVAYHGAAGVLVERFDPADTLDLVARRGVTAIVGVPPMYIAWSLLPDVAAPFASVRLAVCGAAPLELGAAARFAEATGRPIVEGYGLTETAPVLTSTVLSPRPKSGSIGRPIPGVELRLVAPDGSVLFSSSPEGAEPDADEAEALDHEAPTSPGTDPGEIVVRGANLFSGYWPDGRDGPDENGWWATGDVAYADGDEDLFLVDRLGELILVSGFNVYPHEVEQVLCAHPGVADAAVVAIPHPYTGQTVKAYLVREPGTDVSADELRQHCERNLARFKCPTALEFVPELPYSATGKVRKAALGSGGGDG
jgi:long-chain acyl-CoA synthetase